jgi:tetratricopeptide (TPR) repeat protein
LYLADAYYEAGKHAEAIEAALKAAELNPQSADAYYTLGRAYLARGKRDAALEQYNKLKELKDEEYSQKLYQLINR